MGRTFHKVLVLLLGIFVTVGLNLPVVEAIAAPMPTQSVMTMDMPGMAMKGMTDSGSKGGCPHCPDMGGVPSPNCGLTCLPLIADNTPSEFGQGALSVATYVIAEPALKGYSLAPETGPPRTLSRV